jgi:hypothetical protein
MPVPSFQGYWLERMFCVFHISPAHAFFPVILTLNTIKCTAQTVKLLIGHVLRRAETSFLLRPNIPPVTPFTILNLFTPKFHTPTHTQRL